LVEAVYRAVKQAIILDTPDLPHRSATAAAIALRANLSDVTGLSAAEQALMTEWLDRVSTSSVPTKTA
jgi:hypothetical protein